MGGELNSKKKNFLVDGDGDEASPPLFFPPAHRFSSLEKTKTKRENAPFSQHSSRESPNWRRGPTDKPHLCNNCGVYYSRNESLEGYMPGARMLASANGASLRF